MISTNITKAKDAKVHVARRAKRTEQFKVIDGDSPYAVLSEEGEALRTDIKTIDDQLQVDIDNAETEEELKALLESIETAYDFKGV